MGLVAQSPLPRAICLSVPCLSFLLAVDALSDAASWTALAGLVTLAAAGTRVIFLCISQQNRI